MRALAAVVALLVCSCLAHAQAPRTHLPRALLAALGVKHQSPISKILDCTETLGAAKCLNALSLYRAENALDAFESGRALNLPDVAKDIRKFPWQSYSNNTEEELYSMLCDRAEKLLRHRALSLSVPGYSLLLDSKGNGTLNVDVLKNDDVGTSRDMVKKFRKQFYNMVPILLIPGLIMSAILPFVLPAMKLMTIGVGMINNMALSGAVFTLLRNNAFTDKYEHKIIYVNEGYKNEKISPLYFKDFKDGHFPFDEVPLDYAGSNLQEVVQLPNDALVEVPSDADWLNQYYGNEAGNVAINVNGQGKIKRSQRTSNRRTSRL